jgi:hypothetical protein
MLIEIPALMRVSGHSLLNVAVSNMTFLRGIGSNPMEIGNFSKLWHTSNFFC